MILIAALAAPGVAHAQWRDHARVSVNAGIQQPASTTFTSTATKPVFLETASINTSYAVPKSQSFDGGILVRIVGGFGAGVAVSSFSKSSSATVSGSIPHPFFFNTPRALSGAVASAERNETGVHIQAAYVVSSKRIDVAIAGGPTFFNVSQDLVGDVVYTDVYPYDTVTFTSATVSRARATQMGFNVGADVGVKFSKNIGVGGVIRFSRATANLPLTGSTSGVNVDVGGVQAGGGVRFFF